MKIWRSTVVLLPAILTVLAACHIPFKKSVGIYTVTFNSNGGSSVSDQQMVEGNPIVEPIPPTLSGHIFAGWYSDSGLTEAWDFSSGTVNGDMTLYAKWKNNGAGESSLIDALYVQGGTFQMGSTDSDADEEESPVHPVTVSSFYISRYEVSSRQYLEFLNNGEVSADEDYVLLNDNKMILLNASSAAYTYDGTEFLFVESGKGDSIDKPVSYVTWYGAVEYCNWLSGKDGLTKVYTVSKDTVTWNKDANGWRLPTEAEWEFAARGGIESKGYKYSGSNIAEDVGWYELNADENNSVTQKAANELGLYNMSGNVSEWCWDWFGNYPSNAQINPFGASGIERVIRGGAQNSPVSELRSTYRGRAQPNNAASRGGFRPVRWETPPSIYRISFNANGGNDVPSQELSEDGYAAEPESPRQDGYAFMGWYTDSDLTNVWAFATDAVKSDMTLYARWAILRMLSFDANGGSAVRSQEAADGGHAAEPVSPKRDGHAFMGWYTESTLTSPWDFDSGVVNGDMTLYAKWELIKRRVSFTVNGGSAVQEQEVAEGAHAVEPAASGKSGYVFMGWYSDSGLSDAWDFDSGVVNGDMMLYARWGGTVSFEVNGGSAVQEQEVAEGSHAVEPSPPTRNGYAFMGWYSNSGLSDAWDFGSDTVNGNMTLYARWSGTVSFASNGGSAVQEQEVAEGAHAAEPSAPGKSGYVFMGWYTDSGLTNAWNFVSDTVNGDMTLYARWGGTVSFASNGGSAVQEQEVPEGSHAVEPSPPTRSGYTFMGWYSDSGLTNAWNFVSDTVNGDMTLYARWGGTVSFASNGGSAVQEQEVPEGSHAVEPSPPTRSGYAFMGWYTDSGLTNAWNFVSDTVNGDMTLYARWANLRTLSFTVNGGSAVQEQKVPEGNHAVEPTAPNKVGYVFIGWYTDSGLTNAWDFGSDTVNGDMTLYAKWEVIRYTVNFNSNGGSAVLSQGVADGGHAVEPNAPTKSGYVFMGWYADSGLTNVWNFGSDTVNGDMTLYARWVIARTIIFNSNGGSAVQEQEVAEGSHAVEPSAPGKGGYIFMGWYSDSGLSNAWNFGSDTVNGNMTLYAKWGGTVSFDTNGGSAVQEQEVAEGSYAAEPSTPGKSGYIFMGWYTDSGLTNAWNFGSDTVNGNMTLYARWGGTVSFDTNGGSAVQEQEVAEGDHAAEPTTPTKGGYIFMGWYTDSGLTNAWNFGSDTVNGNMTLYARWGGTVSFDTNGGSAVQEQKVAEGSHAVAPSAPGKGGYAFMGWYTDSGLTNAWNFGSDTVDGDMTLYAKWEQIRYTVNFNANGGSAVQEQEVAEGGHAVEPSPPTRSGYVFDGWYADSGLTNAWNFGSDTVDGDMTLYAKWEQIRYTVNFNANGGSAVQEQEVAEGGHAAEPSPPTRSGHTFDGWYTDSGLTNAWSFGSDTVDSNITLYAKWVSSGSGSTIPKMIFVQGGTFQMGSTDSEANSDESPVHSVTLDSFYMAETEITFDQYDAYCEDTGISKPNDANYGRGSRPVIKVSWYDMLKYCNWLSDQEGLTPAYEINGTSVTWNQSIRGYRLPTEAEWEYAARGGAQSQGYKYAGSNSVNEVGWYWTDIDVMSQPVKSKKANELGLYDMSGNVYEWCWDWYGSDYYSSSPPSNPTGPSSGSRRVIRGGTWFTEPAFLRVAFRNNRSPDRTDGLALGFRVVLSK